MKTLLMYVLASFLAITTFAQTVTLTFEGNSNRNRNYSVVIDNTTYLSTDATGNASSQADANGTKTITINNLSYGSHTLAVYRIRANNATGNNASIYSNTFQVRQGYDMGITIKGNSEVTFSEKKIRRNNNNNNSQYRTPMGNAEFSSLSESVRSKWQQSSKVATLSEAFNNTSYYFSTAQIRQLLLLVKSEQSRLDLAKLAWMRVSDANNFAQLNDVFTSQTYRDDLYRYTRNTNNTTTTNPNDQGNTKTPMASYQFSQLTQSIGYASSQSSKFSIIRDAFNNTANYFSTAQVKQLLQTQTSETDRLYLAKLAFARTTDQMYFTSLFDLFSSQANRDELARFTGNTVTTTTTTNTNVRTPMTDASFNQLYQAAAGHFFQASTLKAVRDAVSNSANIFSLAQARQLLSLVQSETDKLALAKLAYARASDPAAFSALTDIFTTQISRDEYTAFIGGTVNTNSQYSSRTPISESSFNQLYTAANSHFRQSSKVTAVRDAFNTGNYFTVAQIRQLLTIITTEADRLELAKLAYRRASDPTYYSQLGDLFSSQSSRDELNVYISANRY